MKLLRIRAFIIRNLAFGVLALFPLVATAYVVIALINFSDTFLFNLMPVWMRPEEIFGRRIPGLGIVITLFVIFCTGILTGNFFGRKIQAWLEKFIARIPFFRTFYSAIRQFLESIFMDRSQAFREVVLIEYPRRGLHTLAFVTSVLENEDKSKSLFTIFVPTTPNPTSGFFLILRAPEVTRIDLRVEEAFRLIVSGGVLSSSSSSDLLERINASISK